MKEFWPEIKFGPVNLRSCWSLRQVNYHTKEATLNSEPHLTVRNKIAKRSVKQRTSRLEELEMLCRVWHHDRNLINGSTDKDQYLKLIQECGELSESICKGECVADDIGDIAIVLVNISTRNGLSLRDCLEVAWGDIKDRKGKMVDGIFIKEEVNEGT